MKYFLVWWIASRATIQTAFSNRLGVILFTAAKMIRFTLFFVFLFFVSEKTKALAGYNTNQILFFFVTFNIVDIVAQMFFREVYRFRPQIVTGNFDLVLSRPVSPLFRSLLGGTDVLDFLVLLPLLVLAFVIGNSFHPVLFDVALYVFFLLNALVLAATFHITVLALGILTTAIDHTIMIYRDITTMGRIPIDFYKEPIRGILTFAIPVGIMMSLPAKVLMGIFDWPIALYGLVFSGVMFLLSLKFWNFALDRYSSASS